MENKDARMREAIPLYVLNVIHEGAIGVPTPIAHRFFNATAGMAPYSNLWWYKKITSKNLHQVFSRYDACYEEKAPP